MTARARKKPELRMPALSCQVPACGQKYPPIGDYGDTDRAALLGGWVYRAGQWLCRAHRDHIPWWPGRPLLALPLREPGATTRAEFVGVVPRDVSWSTAALPAPEPDLEPLPEPDALDDATRKLAALHDRYVAGEDVTAEVDQIVHDYHLQLGDPQPGAEQPAGSCRKCGRPVFADSRHEANDRMTCPSDPQPGGTIYPDLTPEALAGGVPLGSLAPGQEDEEAEA